MVLSAVADVAVTILWSAVSSADIAPNHATPSMVLGHRALGRRVMNEVRPRPPAHQPTAPRTPRHPTHRPAAPQVTRLVVVSWGKASKEKKEAAADKMGLERGA